MHGRAVLMVVAAAASACSHAAVPASGAGGVSCSVGAYAGSPAGLSGEDACALVRTRVAESIAADAALRGMALAIRLDLSRPGSVIAVVSRDGQIYPDMAIDVMDRALVRDDLVRLADLVIQTIAIDSPRP